MVSHGRACDNPRIQGARASGHLIRSYPRMAIAIRKVREHKLDSIFALNNAAGATILPLDAARIREFYEQAAYFRVAEADGHLAGFLIALRENAAYDSPNFLWFQK